VALVGAAASRPQTAIVRQWHGVGGADGALTFGYDAADGSFRWETRAAGGAVAGRYGYVDAAGAVRVVHYAADPARGYRVLFQNVTAAVATLRYVQTNIFTEPHFT